MSRRRNEGRLGIGHRLVAKAHGVAAIGRAVAAAVAITIAGAGAYRQSQGQIGYSCATLVVQSVDAARIAVPGRFCTNTCGCSGPAM